MSRGGSFRKLIRNMRKLEETKRMSDDEAPPKVIRADFSPIGLSIERPFGKRFCTHAQSIIDPNRRTLTCRGCGALLDPIKELEKFARRSESYLWMRKEERRIQEEIEDLKRQVRNLKAQKRRAERKD